MSVRGKYPGFALYMQKGSWNEKIAIFGGKHSGFPNKQSLQGGALSGDLLARKSVPAISLGWGPWLQMTSALMCLASGDQALSTILLSI